MLKRLRAVGLGLGALLLLACGAVGTTGSGAAAWSELSGSEWLLRSLRGEPPLPGTQATLTFTESGIGGFSGCNQFGGALPGTTVGEESSFEMTAMACGEPEGVMEQETAYLQALQEAATFRVEEERLTLLDAGGVPLLEFEARPTYADDPAALLGSAWVLVSLNGTAIEAELRTVTLAFVAEGIAVGRAGCRHVMAGYESGQGTLHVLSLAMMDPEGCEARGTFWAQEGDFTDALGWSRHFQLAEGALELISERGDLLRFEPFPETEMPDLEGSLWQLAAFVEASADTFTPAQMAEPLRESTISLAFDAEGVSGSAGCNAFRAPATRDDAALHIGTPAREKKLCAAPDGIMEQEARFLDALAGVSGYRRAGSYLWLDTQGGGALLFTPE